jgi:hypothetical protein
MAIPAAENATFLTTLNQIKHEFEIYLDTGAGEADNKKRPINPNSIINLTIEDSLANWAVRGALTIFYTQEVEDALYNNSLVQYLNPENANIDAIKNPGYNFRNDGYDLLRIRIAPKLNDENLPNESTLKITDPVHWSLSYLFSVYDVEDIDLPPGAQNQASATLKCLKLYFWDSWYQKLISKVLEYSTGLSKESNALQDIQEGIVSNPGTIYTGQAIKEIITLGLGGDGRQENYDSFSYTNLDPALKISGNPIKEDDGSWDTGAAKMFYTAPADATAYDSLMYILGKHVSSTSVPVDPAKEPLHDISILFKERGPDDTDTGQLTLKPITSFFKEAGNEPNKPGKYQIEHFFLQSYGDSKKASKMLRAPIGEDNNDVIDFTSLKYSTITNYRFVDISALTNTVEFCNKPVYSFDFKNRVFNIEFKNNSVKSARDFMNEQYIKQLYRNPKSDLNDIFLIELNKEKENLNTKPAFSLYGDSPLLRQADGIHKLLYTGLFQNTAINFRALGLTNREPGRFIAIDKTEGVEQGSFEDKFFGQWFVINVRHIIESEIYYNDITAVKIHRFQNKLEEFPGTI